MGGYWGGVVGWARGVVRMRCVLGLAEERILDRHWCNSEPARLLATHTLCRLKPDRDHAKPRDLYFDMPVRKPIKEKKTLQKIRVKEAQASLFTPEYRTYSRSLKCSCLIPFGLASAKASMAPLGVNPHRSTR